MFNILSKFSTKVSDKNSYSDNICDNIDYDDISGYEELNISSETREIRISSKNYNNFRYIYASPVEKKFLIVNLIFPKIINNKNSVILDKYMRNNFVIKNVISSNEKINKTKTENWGDSYKPDARNYRIHHIMNKVFNNRLNNIDIEVMIPNKENNITGYYINKVPIGCDIYEFDSMYGETNRKESYNKRNYKNYNAIHKLNKDEQHKILKCMLDNFDNLNNQVRCDVLNLIGNLPNGLIRNFNLELAHIFHLNDDRMYLFDFGSSFRTSNNNINEIIDITLRNYKNNQNYIKNSNVVNYLNKIAGSIYSLNYKPDKSDEFMSEIYWEIFNTEVGTDSNRCKDTSDKIKCKRKFLSSWLESCNSGLEIKEKHISAIISSSLDSESANYNYHSILIDIINGEYNNLLNVDKKEELIEKNKDPILERIRLILDSNRLDDQINPDNITQNLEKAIYRLSNH